MLNDLVKHSPDDIRFLKLSIDLLTTQINDAIAEKKLDDALQQYRTILEFRNIIFREEPTSQNASLLMGAQKSLASFLLAMRRFDEAEKFLLSSQAMLPRLQLPEADKLSQQASLDISFGDIARSRKEWKQAQEHYLKATSVIKSLRQQFPMNQGFLYDDLSVKGKSIELQLESGNPPTALPQLRSFVTMVDKIIQEHPENTSIASLQQHYLRLLQKLEATIQQ